MKICHGNCRNCKSQKKENLYSSAGKSVLTTFSSWHLSNQWFLPNKKVFNLTLYGQTCQKIYLNTLGWNCYTRSTFDDGTCVLEGKSETVERKMSPRMNGFLRQNIIQRITGQTTWSIVHLSPWGHFEGSKQRCFLTRKSNPKLARNPSKIIGLWQCCKKLLLRTGKTICTT